MHTKLRSLSIVHKPQNNIFLIILMTYIQSIKVYCSNLITLQKTTVKLLYVVFIWYGLEFLTPLQNQQINRFIN